ncbi:uncharacterized protein METZ01_LOCUS208368, partial [marine metagenome]
LIFKQLEAVNAFFNDDNFTNYLGWEELRRMQNS